MKKAKAQEWIVKRVKRPPGSKSYFAPKQRNGQGFVYHAPRVVVVRTNGKYINLLAGDSVDISFPDNMTHLEINTYAIHQAS